MEEMQAGPVLGMTASRLMRFGGEPQQVRKKLSKFRKHANFYKNTHGYGPTGCNRKGHRRNSAGARGEDAGERPNAFPLLSFLAP